MHAMIGIEVPDESSQNGGFASRNASRDNPGPTAFPEAREFAMPSRVSIIGDGSMAMVCAMLLESNGHDVIVWGHNPEHVATLAETHENTRHLRGYRIPESVRITGGDAAVFRASGDKASVTAAPELIVSAVPTQHIRSVWTRLLPHVPPRVPIVSVAKGIENDTLLRPTQIIADVLAGKGEKPPARSFAALSGPSIADELARRLPATVCAASDDEALARFVQVAFSTQWFRVYTNNDLLGVELAGATKNVIALAAGILDGLNAGANAKSALLSRGLAEIVRLGDAMGASRDTFFGIAGVGDLVTTCFSKSGRNRSCGEELGKGRKLHEVLAANASVVEGVPTTKAVVGLAKRHGVDMPITHAVYHVLFNGLNPIEAISKLMSRDLKPE